MLPRDNRLRSGDEIREVTKRGEKAATKHFVLHYSHAQNPRFAVITGRVLGNAVIRNRIKRRITNSIRENLSFLSYPVDAVFRMRRSALDCSFEELDSLVRKTFIELKK